MMFSKKNTGSNPDKPRNLKIHMFSPETDSFSLPQSVVQKINSNLNFATQGKYQCHRPQIAWKCIRHSPLILEVRAPIAKAIWGKAIWGNKKNSGNCDMNLLPSHTTIST